MFGAVIGPKLSKQLIVYIKCSALDGIHICNQKYCKNNCCNTESEMHNYLYTKIYIFVKSPLQIIHLFYLILLWVLKFLKIMFLGQCGLVSK